MFDNIITWSLDNRAVVLGASLILAVMGAQAAQELPMDAFPDTTPAQVQVNTIAPALSPEEIEAQVTFPVEQAISGLPRLVQVRSISKYGLSQVTVVFEDGTDIFQARQWLLERLQTVDLPEGVPRPEMGPIATGLGEVFHYILSSDELSLEALTTLHDWEVKPRLRSVPGVAEVNTWGGEARQFQVVVDLPALFAAQLSLDELVSALQRNNLSVGGGLIAEGGELHVIRGLGLATTTEELGAIVVATRRGVPLRVDDLAEVRVGHELRRGAATANGGGEVVLGLGFMLMGENSDEVTRRIAARLDEVARDLPAGVELRPVYERTELIDEVLATVEANLFEGALLVVAVLFAFLGNLRAGLIVASAIPLSMLLAAQGMLRFGVAGSLMSLGAIDFGLIVDSAVIMIENNVRRLGEGEGDRKEIVRRASLEVRRPTMFGELIIMVVYLPVLTLEGVEGQLFRPMALTVIFALLGSLVLSLTLMPVLASLLLRGGEEREGLLTRAMQAGYRPLVRAALRWRWLFIACAAGLLALGLGLSTRLGTEFVPRLSEGSIVINTVRLSGVSLEESVRYGTQIERHLLARFPDEIRDIWTRTGTAEVATDPMGIEVSDVFITLQPQAQWRRGASQAELADAMRRALEDLPGMRAVFSQPIELRLNEMVAGIRADLGVKVFGDDLERLKVLAAQAQAILEQVEGCADPYTEQLTGQPVLEVEVDRDAVARLGIPASHVLELVQALGSWTVGEVREGQRRFDLALRLDDASRSSPEAIRELLLPTPRGGHVPLSQVARIRQVEGPSTITREWQRRRVLVQCNIKDRDMGGFVAEARWRLEAELDLQPGEHLSFGGSFEHLERAQRRLMWVVPIALALILLLLASSTERITDALIVFSGAPFAALGGVVALWLRDMPLTVPAGVGFVAVSGVAMLNGLVLMSTLRAELARGTPRLAAIESSAVSRLRPVVMTACVAGLGFVPMAFNTGIGAEVQRPLATVVLGGVISDNLLTLLVLPALAAVFARRGEEQA